MAETSNESLLIHRKCCACGEDNSDRPALSYSKDHWQIKSCAACGFVYLENAPDYEALVSSDHAWENSYLDEKRRRRKGRFLRYLISDGLKWIKIRRRGGKGHVKIHHYISRYFPEGRVLDVGCGTGNTFKRLSEKTIPYGIEVSRALAEQSQAICEPKGGRVVQDMALDGFESFEDDFFDGIIMRAYLEHEVNPLQVLEKSYRVIKPGGSLIIKVPNFGSLNCRVTGKRWCGFRFPDHVNYFTPSSLVIMVEKAGYRVAQFGFLDHLPISDNMWLVARR